MAGRDRIIDPVTKDYVRDDNGNCETETDGRTSVYHQLTDEKDTWWGDPDAGSDLHKLARAKNGEVALARAADITRAALEPLEEAGVIDQVEVQVERDQANRLVIASQQRSVQSGETKSAIIAIVG
jgi:phage gp46-like protein